ncbi:MAG: DUF354 domain-containing protein [Candidatus Latescibacteria bacterium]|nr:DUF354 domain-containing protein [Candidatus Latescibacterota bacterium]
MKIWFDADNGPHVLIMRPLVGELRQRGHEVVFTARDRTSTCELLDLYGLEYIKVGGAYRPGISGKVAGTLGRAEALMRAARHLRADVSFGHGSRALPIASRLLGVPTVTMYDYEWVDPRLFNLFCKRILLPRAIDRERAAAAGLAVDKVVFYDGLKEELYVAGGERDGTVARELGLREEAIRILLRPPATTAHYHNPESELLLAELLRVMGTRPDVQMVFMPRGPEQLAFVPADFRGQVIVPDRVYDGPSLIAAMDLVISGGGTMTREAAVLGVASYSFFRGREGRVDEWLERTGHLVMLRSVGEIAAKLVLAQKPTASSYVINTGLVGQVADAILAAAR